MNKNKNENNQNKKNRKKVNTKKIKVLLKELNLFQYYNLTC